MVKARLCWVMVLLVLGGRLSLAEIKIKGDVFIMEAEEFSSVEGEVYVGRERDQGKVVAFKNGTDHIQAEISLSSKAAVEVWLLAYFPWAGADTLQIALDGKETKVCVNYAASSRFWDMGNFGSWHWRKVGRYDMAAGSHTLRIGAAEQKDQEIDQVVFYSGKEPFFLREEIFGERAAALKKATAVSLPASFESYLLSGEKPSFTRGESGSAASYSYFALKRDGDRLDFLVECPAQRTVQVWARAWYRHKNVFDGNTLEEFDHLFHFYLDGQLRRSVFETDEQRWHWVLLGEYELSPGSHLLSLGKKGDEVKIEGVVLYAGDNVHQEDWFKASLAHLVPDDLENDIAFEDAHTVGGWRFFGTLGEEAGATFSLKDEQGHRFPLELTLPKKTGTLILQKSRPLESAESWLAAPAKLGVWVKGKNGSESLSAVISNRAGTTTRLIMGKIDFSDWRMLSVQIPSSFLRENIAAYPALPVRFTHLVIEKDKEDQGSLVLGEPFFISPFQVTGMKKEKETGEGDRFEVDISLRIMNRADVRHEGQVHAALSPVAGEGEVASLGPVTFTVGGKDEGKARLSFAAAGGVYRLSVAFSGEKPREFLLAIGKEVSAAALARLEKENGCFAVRPLDIPRDKVREEYGKSYQILSGGVDITSWEYAEGKDYPRPLAVKEYDLSDQAGWPFVTVPHGQIALDPRLGRMKFCTGDEDPIRVAAKAPVGFGVPGERFYLRDDFAFIPGGEGDITVIDISSPAEPRLASFIPHWYFQHTLHFYQNYAYSSSSHRGIFLVDDVSNPHLPGKIREVHVDRGKYANLSGILEEKKLAAFTGKEGLYFLSLENPFYPKEKLLIEGAEGFIVCQQGKYALTYLEGKKAIGLLSLSGSLPELVRQVEMPLEPADSKPGRIIAVGEKFFAVLLKEEVVIYTIPDLARLGVVSLKEKLANAKPVVIRDGAFVKDHYLYLLDGRQPSSQHSLSVDSPASRIFVFKVDWNKESVEEVFTFQEEKPTEYSRITVRGDYAYVSDYNFGLWTFDVSNPERPRKLGGAPVAAEGHFVGVGDTTALCAGTFGGVTYSIDITDPFSPRVKDFWWDGSWLSYDNLFHTKIPTKGDVGFLMKPGKIEVMDFSGEEAKLLGQIPCGKSGNHFLVRGERGYLMSQGNLTIYDLSRPEKPKKLGRKSGLIPGNKWGVVAKRGDRLYVAVSRDKTFHVVDISDPQNIKEVGRLELDDKEEFREAALLLKDQYAITLANYYSHQIRLVDISDDTAPSLVKSLVPLEKRGVVDWADFYQGLISDGKYLFVGSYGQIECYDISRLPEVQFKDKKTFGFQWKGGWLKEGLLYTLGLQALYIVDVPCGSQFPDEVTLKPTGASTQ